MADINFNDLDPKTQQAVRNQLNIKSPTLKRTNNLVDSDQVQQQMKAYARRTHPDASNADLEKVVKKLSKTLEEVVKTQQALSKAYDKQERTLKDSIKVQKDILAAYKAQPKQNAIEIQKTELALKSMQDQLLATIRANEQTGFRTAKLFATKEGDRTKASEYADLKKAFLAEQDRINQEYNRRLALNKVSFGEDTLAREEADNEARKWMEGATAENEQKLVGIIGGPLLSTATKALSVLGKINTTLGQSVTEYASLATQYLGHLDARLQGTSEYTAGAFKEINKWMDANNLTSSPLLSNKKLIENIGTLADAGIAYNLEERALISTLTDKLVTTFNALDSSLTRLIRLQGQDLTMNLAGSEATLTQLLNSMFKDSSYLTDMYDSVSAALVDANAQMTADQAVSFNYAVQKWLGSLYSVGMSQSGVSTIAQGLSYLATGDVNALNGNESMQTLLALSAKNAGLSYASMLTGGVSAEDVNKLMSSMVQYLQEIAGNTDNMVTRSAWSGITGLNISDLSAMTNLTAADLSAIAGQNMNLASSQAAFNAQLDQVYNRTFVAEMYDNVYNNVMLAFGKTLIGTETNTESLVKYLAWRAGDMLGGTFGTILQGGTAALSIIEDLLTGENSSLWSIIEGAGGWFNGGSKLDLFNTLGASEAYNTRGDMLSTIANANAVATGMSYSVNAITGSSAGASDITGTQTKLAESVGDVYNELFVSQSKPIRVKLASVEPEAISSLGVDAVNYLADQAAATGILIDIAANDADSIINAIKEMRRM